MLTCIRVVRQGTSNAKKEDKEREEEGIIAY